MKRLLFIILLLTSLSASAQHNFMFKGFQKAHITFRNRSKADVQLNFDVTDQKMYFLDGETLMEMTNPEMVDTIFVAGSRFVYKDNRFCEVLSRKGENFYINWYLKKVYGGNKGAFGMPTQAKVEVLKKLDFDEVFILGNWGDYEGQETYSVNIWNEASDNTYYFTLDGQEYKIKRLKDLYKAFPDQADQLKAYAKENSYKMTNAEDAIKMIDYLYSIR